MCKHVLQTLKTISSRKKKCKNLYLMRVHPICGNRNALPLICEQITLSFVFSLLLPPLRSYSLVLARTLSFAVCSNFSCQLNNFFCYVILPEAIPHYAIIWISFGPSNLSHRKLWLSISLLRRRAASQGSSQFICCYAPQTFTFLFFIFNPEN